MLHHIHGSSGVRLTQPATFVLCILIAFFVTQPVLAEDQSDAVKDTWAYRSTIPPTGPIVRYYEPMVLGCHDMKILLGVPFEKLVLYVFWEDQWREIPYQLDDRLPDNRMVFLGGPQANPEDANNKLDAEDELIFMVRDIGLKKEKDTWPETVAKGIEISVIDPVDKTKGFAYLFHIPSRKNAVKSNGLLVTGETESRYYGGSHLWRVEGLTNEHKGKLYKTLINEHISLPTLAGGSGINFIDRLKMRFEVRMLFGMIKLKLDEENMIGEVSQYRKGPLRLSSRAWTQITLPANLKAPKMWTEINLYETLTVSPIIIRVPFNPGAVVTDFRMSTGYDLNPHAKGMKYYNSNNLKGFLVDGIPTEDEKNMDTSLDEWGCVTGPQGSILLYTDWDEEYRAQAKVNTYFVDDISKENSPDNYPGQMGYFYTQSVMKSLKARDYKLAFYICFPPYFYDPKGLKLDIVKQYVNILHNPTYAVINGNINKNRTGDQLPLWNSFD